jgi:hypothetical protein
VICSFGKTIKENRVAEIIGKKSQKIVEKLGIQECGPEWVLEHTNLERKFPDLRNFRKC